MVRQRNRNRSEDTSNQEPAPRTQARQAAPEPERTEERQPERSQAAPAQSNVPAVQETRSLGGVNARNAFESYGQQMSISSITGTLIKFNKGDWVTGDDEDLDENMEVVANMDSLMVGWIKWVDNRPAEQIMGPVAEGYQPPRRNELGDMDQDDWENDEQGRPRDPWQFSNYIVLKEPGQPATEENLYTFATSSKGGLGAIGAVCRDYGKQMRTRPDEYPIIKLGTDSYQHRVYGRTKVPVLTIVGWEPKAQFEQVAEVSRQPAAEPEPAEQPRRAAGGRRR